MDKLVKFLQSDIFENKEINFKNVKYGGHGVYTTIPVIEGVRVRYNKNRIEEIYISKFLEENKEYKKYNCTTEKGSHGFVTAIISLKNEYNAMKKAEKEDDKKLDEFFKLFKERGRSAAMEYDKQNAINNPLQMSIKYN